MSKTLIAICGPAGSGKTTLANLLVEHYGFIRLPFAGPIKEMIRSVLKLQGVSQDTIYRMLNGDLKEVPTPLLSDRTPRHAMQTLGTEWRNLMHQNFWLNIWTGAAEGIRKVVVDDLRFRHEANLIDKLGGKIIKLSRPGVGPGEHQSEKEFEEIAADLTMMNSREPKEMLFDLEQFLNLREESILQ